MTIMLISAVLLVFGSFGYKVGSEAKNAVILLIGCLLFLAGFVLTICFFIPTDNYTGWKGISGKITILEMEEKQYFIERENEYIYKTVIYSYSGENNIEYKEIEKQKNVSVEFVENDENKEAYLMIFTKNVKNLFGEVLDGEYQQIKYVFYIPNK